MEQEKMIIPLEKVTTEFEDLMSLPENKRVFFSGKFGSGKTFFLKEFFEREENIEKYEVFHLYPVNYQISENHDVVSLIKYDILLELYKRDNTLFDSDVEATTKSEEFQLLLKYIKKEVNIKDILRQGIAALSSAGAASGDPTTTIFSSLGKPFIDLLSFDDEFQSFIKVEKGTDKQEDVNNFIAEVRKLDISADDYVSFLIAEEVKNLKGSKKSILIIDDIDRIDPDHLFRIMNVFSSQFDDSDKNKFGFDMVILVGHVDNIKSIFAHKYGEDTDFNGYFDKFYTAEPYYFNNNKAVKEAVPQMVRKIQSNDTFIKKALENHEYLATVLEETIYDIIQVKGLNVRDLYKPINSEFTSLKEKTFYNDEFVSKIPQQFDIGMQVIIGMVGGVSDFIEIISRIKKLKLDKEYDDVYRVCSGVMLSSIMDVDINSPHTLWEKDGNKYDVRVTSRGSNHPTVVDEIYEGDIYEMYLDLLSVYLTRGLHVKENNYQYDK
jgi:hypothetical protein